MNDSRVCPFCGGNKIHLETESTGHGSGDPVLKCECGCSLLGTWMSETKLREKWNVRAEIDETLAFIEQHGLLVRPSFTGGWRAGVWKGVTGHDMGQAYCEAGTEWEGKTIKEAVATCVDALKGGRINPQFEELRGMPPA